MITLIFWIIGIAAFLVAALFAGMGLHALIATLSDLDYKDGPDIFIGLFVGIIMIGIGVVGVLLLPSLAFGWVTLQDFGTGGKP